jgi:hypothetical protein
MRLPSAQPIHRSIFSSHQAWLISTAHFNPFVSRANAAMYYATI